MGKKKFKIFFNEEGWERVVGGGFDTMLFDHTAKFIDRCKIKRRELKGVRG